MSACVRMGWLVPPAAWTGTASSRAHATRPPSEGLSERRNDPQVLPTTA